MKRKRFVRLLMAHGIQRNDAAAATRAASGCAFGSYEKAYAAFQKLDPYPWYYRVHIMKRVIQKCTVENHFRKMLNWDKAERLARLWYITAYWNDFEKTAFEWGLDLASAPDFAVVHHNRPPRRNDAVDAFVYAFLVMSRHEHAAAHGMCGKRADLVILDEDVSGNGGSEC